MEGDRLRWPGGAPGPAMPEAACTIPFQLPEWITCLSCAGYSELGCCHVQPQLPALDTMGLKVKTVPSGETEG